MTDQVPERAKRTIAEAIADPDAHHLPVTLDTCDHVEGPFFHGTVADLEAGDLVVAGQASNYQAGRIANHVYVATLLEPAVWGAELAAALGGGGRERIYVVEPTGPFEDDPNVTDKEFPGNPTRSFRTAASLRIVAERDDWTRLTPEALGAWRARLETLRDGNAEIIN